jgi:hypothetical protein
MRLVGGKSRDSDIGVSAPRLLRLGESTQTTKLELELELPVDFAAATCDLCSTFNFLSLQPAPCTLILLCIALHVIVE